jgi:Ca-activated chloride channel family protein
VKNIQPNTFSLLALFCLFFIFSSAFSTEDLRSKVLFILDGSGSMWGQVEGKHKIVIAKEVMSNLIRDLHDNVDAGLEVYGHRSKGDCEDIEILAPVGGSDKATLLQRIQEINPKGKTPISRSLELAASQLREFEEETTVVLVSDGDETCDADSCALVRELRTSGVQVRVHVEKKVESPLRLKALPSWPWMVKATDQFRAA